MKTSLSKSSNFPMSSKSIPYSYSSTVTTFCKGLSTSFSSLFMNLLSFSFWSHYRIKRFFSYHVLVNLLQYSVWIINNHFVTIFSAILHTESYHEIGNNILKQGFIMAPMNIAKLSRTPFSKNTKNTWGDSCHWVKVVGWPLIT